MIKAIDSRGVMDREDAFALKKFSWKSLSPHYFMVISSNASEEKKHLPSYQLYNVYIVLEDRNLALIRFLGHR